MQLELIEKNAILKLSFDFSLMVISYCEKLNIERKYVISKQLLRSGTSIGVNATEAQSSESRADFIREMKIAGKESVETQYSPMLCKYSKDYPDGDSLLLKLEEISKVLNKILSPARRKSPLSFFLSYFL